MTNGNHDLPRTLHVEPTSRCNLACAVITSYSIHYTKLYEVRKLAEKTMTATQEVGQVITEIQSVSASAVTEMSTTRTRVEKATGLVEDSGKVLGEIITQSEAIADMVRSIATASEQQSSTSDEINTNVTDINNNSQEISRRIQEANGRIQDVARMAEHLNTLVERFKS